MSPRLDALLLADVPMVAEIESRQHLTPWRECSFEDALRSGWHARVLRAVAQSAQPPTLVGYFVAMRAGDDEELLTMTVAPEFEGRGYGRFLLQALLREATERGAAQLFLEVRQSNQRAIHLYESVGFTISGMRKNYYPIPADPVLGRPAGREDAVLMVHALGGSLT